MASMTTVRPSAGARRAAALCGLGAALTVVLAAPSSAASARDPGPEDTGAATRSEGTGTRGEGTGTRNGGTGTRGGAAGAKDEGAGTRAGRSGARAVAGDVPSLGIGIDNGRTSVEEGDRLTYVITVRNTGTSRVRGLDLTQSLPPGLRFVSADGHGTATRERVRWSADVPPGKAVTFRTVAEVGTTPEDLLRLASIACASTEGGDKPIVCATHSDQLPAGAAAAEAAHATAHPVTSRLWYVAAGAGLLALVLVGLPAVRRSSGRRRLRRSSER
ncbi:hypothetical protein ACLQ2R_23855 [Streptosporangium sp. DT93]|uniref:hypothetical protein n=1 Tax=Streptosporangium sp. DT93 TaxID=3393428 RepID=UPI003CEF7AD2